VGNLLKTKSVFVEHSPTGVGLNVRAIGSIDNPATTVSSYAVKFSVEDPTGQSIQVFDVDTGSYVTTKTITVPERLLTGTTGTVPWIFRAPGKPGDYVVKAEPVDSVSPEAKKDVSLKVVSPARITADEYPGIMLLALVVLIPVGAYFFLKKREEQEE
jgi:hypothetical protein